MNKVAEYIKNIGKSVVYGAMDVSKELTPSSYETIENNEALLKDIYHGIRDYRNTIRKTKELITGSKLWAAGDVAVHSVYEDILSGNLYNKEREATLGGSAMGMDMDFDDSDINIGFEDSDSSGDAEINISDGEKFVAEANNASSKANAMMISKAIVETSKHNVEITKANTSLLYAQNAAIGAELKSGLFSINDNVSKLLEFSTSTIQTHALNSKTFYETMTKNSQETVAILKEMLEMKRNEYKEKQEIEKANALKQSKKRLGFDDIVSANGGLNIVEYGKVIKKNSESLLSEVGLDMLNSFGDEANPLMAFAASPLQFIPVMLAKALIGPNVMRAAKNFDKTLSGVVGTFVSRMAHHGKDFGDGSDSILLSALGKLLGVKSTVKTTIDSSNYIKGPVPFDGITKKSIVEVIPTYLRKILAALTNREELAFDYKTGQFIKASQIEQNFKDYKRRFEVEGTGELREGFRKIALDSSVRYNTYEERKRMEEIIDQVSNKIYADMGWFDQNKTSDYYNYGLRNEEEKRLINSIYKKLSKEIRMQSAGIAYTKRAQMDREMKDKEINGDIFATLFNNSNIDSHLRKDDKGRVLGLSDPLVEGGGGLTSLPIDKLGWNILDYSKAMLTELKAIRMFGGGVGGPSSLSGIGDISIQSKKKKTIAEEDRDRLYKLARDYEDKNESLKKSLKEKDKYIFLASEDTNEGEDKRISLASRGSKVYGDPKLGYNHPFNIEARRKELQEAKEFQGEFAAWMSNKMGIGTDDDVNDQDKENEALKELIEDEGKTFLEKFNKATGFRDKYEVLKNGISKVFSKPWTYLAASIEKADQHIFDFFFGEQEDNDGKKIKGFFGAMTKKMQETFDHFKTWLDEKVLDPLYKRFDTDSLGGVFKNMLKVVGIDYDAIKESVGNVLEETKDRIKDKFGGFFETSKEAVKKSKDDLLEALGFETTSVPVQPVYNHDAAHIDAERELNYRRKIEKDNATLVKADSYKKLQETRKKYLDFFNEKNKEIESIIKNGDLTPEEKEKAINECRRIQDNIKQKYEDSLLPEERYQRSDYQRFLAGVEVFEKKNSVKKIQAMYEMEAKLQHAKEQEEKNQNFRRVNVKGVFLNDNLVNWEKSAERKEYLRYKDNKTGLKAFDGYDPRSPFKDVNIKELEKAREEEIKNTTLVANTSFEIKNILADKLDKILQNIEAIRSVFVQRFDYTKEAIGLKINRPTTPRQIDNPIDYRDVDYSEDYSASEQLLLEKDLKDINANKLSQEYLSKINNIEKSAFTRILDNLSADVKENKARKESLENFNNFLDKNNSVPNITFWDILDKNFGKAKASETEVPIQEKAKGARYINETGLTTISKGEMIIPSEYNPFNPDRDKVNKRKEIADERKVKKNFLSNISDSIDMNAEGNTSVMSDAEKEERKSRFGKLTLDNTLYKGVENFYSGAKNAARVLVLGNSNEDFGDFGDAISDVTMNVKKYIPEGIAGGLLGGAVGLVTGLASPLLLAAGGAAISIAQNSDKMQDWLFGKKDDKGERGGGFIAKDTQETIKKYFPDLTTYGITGTALGMFTPLGSIGGLLLGSAAAYVKNSDSAQRFLFGDQDDNITRDRQEFIKKAIPNMAIGAGLGAIVGPFGILGGAAFGAASGLAATTATFQEWIIGHEMYDGSREGGLLGLLRVNIVDPLKNFGQDVRDNFLGWLKTDVINPLSSAIAPIGKQIERTIGSSFSFVGNMFKRILEHSLKTTLGAKLQARVLNPIKALGGLGYQAVKKTASKVVSAPFKMVGAYGNMLRKEDILKGRATYMSAEERLRYIQENGLEGDIDTNAYNLDKTLYAVDDIDQLKDVASKLKMSMSGKKAQQDIWDSKKKDIRDELQGKFNLTDANEAIKAVYEGDMDALASVIRRNAEKSKNGKKIFKNNEDMLKFTQAIADKAKALKEAETNLHNFGRDRYAANADIQKQLEAKGVKVNMQDPEEVKRIYELFNKEISAKQASKLPDVEKDPALEIAEEQLETQRKLVYLLAESVGGKTALKVLEGMPEQGLISSILKGEQSVAASKIVDGDDSKVIEDDNLTTDQKQEYINFINHLEKTFGQSKESKTKTMPDGTVVKYKSTTDGGLELDESDPNTKEYLERTRKEAETKERLADSLELSVGTFGDLKKWLFGGKKKKDDKEGGGLLSMLSDVLGLGGGFTKGLAKAGGLLATGASILGKGSLAIAIATMFGPAIIEMGKEVITSLFRGIRSTWPFSLIPGAEQVDENGKPIEASKHDKQLGQGALRIGLFQGEEYLRKMSIKDALKDGKLAEKNGRIISQVTGATSSADDVARYAKLAKDYNSGARLYAPGRALINAGTWAGKQAISMAGSLANHATFGIPKYLAGAAVKGVENLAVNNKIYGIGEKLIEAGFLPQNATKEQILEYIVKHNGNVDNLTGITNGKELMSNAFSRLRNKYSLVDKAAKAITSEGSVFSFAKNLGIKAKDIGSKLLQEGTEAFAQQKAGANVAIEKFIGILNSGKSKLIEIISKFSPKSGEIVEYVITKIIQYTPKVASKIAKLGLASAKIALKLLSYPVMIAGGFAYGAANANRVLSISTRLAKEVTTTQRIFAGCCGAISEAAFGILDYDWIADCLLEAAQFVGMDVSEIMKLRERSSKELAAFNAKNNSNISMEEYNEFTDPTIMGKMKKEFDAFMESDNKAGFLWDRFSSGLSSAVDGITTFVKDVFNNIINGISNMVDNIRISINESLSSLIGYNLTDAKLDFDIGYDTAKSKGYSAVQELGAQMQQDESIGAIGKLAGSVSLAFGGMVGSVAGFFGNIGNKITDFFNFTRETSKEYNRPGLDMIREKIEEDREKTEPIEEPTRKSGSGKYGRGYFSQLDPNLNMRFNTSRDSQYQTMQDSGCGPVSAANALLALNKGIDPREAASYALSNGYKEVNGGTEPGFFGSYFRKHGVDSEYTSGAGIVKQLQQGNPVVLMGQDRQGINDKTPYGDYPHYVTATGLDGKGNMIVQDPEGKQNAKYSIKDMLRTTTAAVAAKRSGMGKMLSKFGRGFFDFFSSGLSEQDLALVLVEITAANEGDYNSVNRNDNNDGPSIGRCQWHKERARDLLNSISGGSKYAQYMMSNSTLDSDIAEEISNLLNTASGKLAQDRLAVQDCLEYIKAAKAVGLTDDKAILYFGSWANTSIYCAQTCVQRSGDCDSLEAIHRAFKAKYNSIAEFNYGNRYDNTYNMIKEIDLKNIDMAKIRQIVAKYKGTSSGASPITKTDKASGFIGQIIDTMMNTKFDQYGGKSITEMQTSLFGSGKGKGKVDYYELAKQAGAPYRNAYQNAELAKVDAALAYLGANKQSSTKAIENSMAQRELRELYDAKVQNANKPDYYELAKQAGAPYRTEEQNNNIKKVDAMLAYLGSGKPSEKAIENSMAQRELRALYDSKVQKDNNKIDDTLQQLATNKQSSNVYEQAKKQEEIQLQQQAKLQAQQAKVQEETQMRIKEQQVQVQTQQQSSSIDYTNILQQILSALLTIVQNTKGLSSEELINSIKQSKAELATNKGRNTFETVKNNINRIGSKAGLGNILNGREDIGFLTAVLNDLATE